MVAATKFGITSLAEVGRASCGQEHHGKGHKGLTIKADKHMRTPTSLAKIAEPCSRDSGGAMAAEVEL